MKLDYHLLGSYLCAMHRTKHFMSIISFYLHNDSSVAIIIPSLHIVEVLARIILPFQIHITLLLTATS